MGLTSSVEGVVFLKATPIVLEASLHLSPGVSHA